MRELATPASATDAQVLVDYLLTQKIEAVVREEDGQSVVWVLREDEIPAAREIWNEFRTQPTDRKYHAAAKPAKELRKLKETVDRKYAAMYKDGDQFWGRPSPLRVPATIVLMVLSIAVTVWTEFGGNSKRLLELTFMDRAGFRIDADLGPLGKQAADENQHHQLEALQKGEVWRLITPIFLHFSIWHLAFNMYALYSLGGLIESRRGTLWLVIFVLVTGIFSNVLQFFLPTLFNFHAQKGIMFGTALFGGMSGVDFALFGYLVAKTLYAPEPGLRLPQDTIASMLIWLVICMTGMLGNIANTAHVAGLAIGFAIGLAPKLLKMLRDRML